jgi:hypothetical protein
MFATEPLKRHLSIVNAQDIGAAHKKSRKQRIPGGRRTLATSGGDWLAILTGASSFQHSDPTDEQYVDCQNGSIRFRSNIRDHLEA